MTKDVGDVLANGETIMAYPDDTPYPNALVLGWVMRRPVHIVFAESPYVRNIITVYQPDPNRWMPDFRSRKP